MRQSAEIMEREILHAILKELDEGHSFAGRGDLIQILEKFLDSEGLKAVEEVKKQLFSFV